MALAPFPAFGGKSAIATEVWSRFGAVRNYVEPCVHSAAMLLLRPEETKHAPQSGTRFEWGIETINDINSHVSNFWRAVKWAPEETASHALWPIIESDMHARQMWLAANKESLRERLEGDPEWFDARAAGWWAWGMNMWLGSMFANGVGPWRV